MRLAPNDILFAHIALHVVPDLSPSARRVGAAIIEHFNKRTGQCDPSIERLGRLLGLSPTSVKAATAELCRGDSALFDRIVNGGHSHRTAYLPRWDRLNDIIADWDLRLKDGTAPSKGRKIGSLRAGKPAVEGPRNRPQTDRRNRGCRLRGWMIVGKFPTALPLRSVAMGFGMKPRPSGRAILSMLCPAERARRRQTPPKRLKRGGWLCGSPSSPHMNVNRHGLRRWVNRHDLRKQPGFGSSPAAPARG